MINVLLSELIFQSADQCSDQELTDRSVAAPAGTKRQKETLNLWEYTCDASLISGKHVLVLVLVLVQSQTGGDHGPF